MVRDGRVELTPLQCRERIPLNYLGLRVLNQQLSKEMHFALSIALFVEPVFDLIRPLACLPES